MARRFSSLRHSLKYSSLAATALLITACTHQTEREQLADLKAKTPSNYKVKTDAVTNKQSDFSGQSDKFTNATLPSNFNWVKDFNDPALENLIAEAMNHNHSLGVSAARMEIARQSAISARSALLPSISQAGVSATRSLNRVAGNDFYATGYGLSANASWEIDLWGRAKDSTKAAYLDASAAKDDFYNARLSIAGGVAQAWYSLIESRQQRELSERNVETNQANLRIIERRYSRGVSSSLDVRLARSQLANSKATLIQTIQGEQQAARSLQVLLGRYPNAEINVATDLPNLGVYENDGRYQAHAQLNIGTPESLLDSHPAVIASEKRLVSAGLNARAAKKAMLPALRLTGSANGNEGDFSDLFNLDNLVANLISSATQPIFQGGRLRANAKLSKAQQELALHNYADTVLNAFSDVETALSAEELLASREEALRLAFEESEASERLTERQYLNGTTTIFNLLNAQQRRNSAEAQFISARNQRISNRIRLYMALGGTFDVGTENFKDKVDDRHLVGERLVDRKYSSERLQAKTPTSLFRRWWRQN